VGCVFPVVPAEEEAMTPCLNELPTDGVVVLNCFRSVRDAWAQSLILWFDSTDEEQVRWFEQIALQGESASSSLEKALAWQADNHRWHLCAELEDFSKFCRRIARLETSQLESLRLHERWAA
jgi:hypothetical protein